MPSEKTGLVAALSPLIIAILVSCSAGPLHAQRLDALRSIRASTDWFELASFSSSAMASPLGAFAPSAGRRTYWLEGGAVGGLALGALGYALGGACPAHTGSCPKGPVGFLIGASVGFVIGAFMGDAIEKK
jgi:hypothetical protein